MRIPRTVLALATAAVLGATAAGPLAAPATAAPVRAAAQAAVQTSASFTAARATANADGSYLISWASNTSQVTVTAATDAAATTGVTVGTGGGTGSVTVPAGTLPGAARWYFRLTAADGSALTVAERSLGLADAHNFRDAGGYRTTDGHWVRTGVVYRSGKLSALTAAEQQVLTDEGITLDVDLRNAAERSDDPDAIPAGVTYQVADVVSLAHGLKFHKDAAATLVKALAAGLFSGSSDLGQSIGYPFMVNFVGADYAFHDALTAVEHNPGATVFHCTAGKDRTGWTNAVLLTLLGVPRATVEADFLASNTYTGDPEAVELSWLDAAFDEVNAIYGSFDGYLHQGLKLTDADIAALKAKLLV
ncbi:tyrosine-protein phosphatase [Actinacidiphila alni]|uniref:tyrosine-protein phosphatase n=1 Tax=Actinacidiphila alni TaxID=380248 RepID=UPI001FE86B40|nr:tyrosine-protein phosphatase [Actinacidiphila alni]